MEMRELRPDGREALERALGYLNFSSGASDPQFLTSLNQLFEAVEAETGRSAVWSEVLTILRQKLRQLERDAQAFQDTSQAARVLEILQEHLLPEYLEFHSDLLFHQSPDELFNAFFVGRAAQAVLQVGADAGAPEVAAQRALTVLNDYIGYRPVPTLQSQKMEPYPHEWVRPVPLYVKDAGIVAGPYRKVIQTALSLLDDADEDLLRSAYFDPSLMDELAFDPRAYDFDHPANKRPNYHFGQWDPHHIDNQGRYRRFVIQQVTLEALMARVDESSELPIDELLFEAAAVLVGTILMASGISGRGPDTHDSTTTLSTLLPRIADYRDAFYDRLLSKMSGAHADRLRAEGVQLQQPFGGARQHLNAELARHRAAQLEHVHLAHIYARMGFPKAAAKQAAVVPVASARMRCEIDCRLTSGIQALEAGKLTRAAALTREIMDVLHRGIECGAFIDPWNILGFDAQYSLFPALENSVHDHRADELIAIVDQILAFYARIWSEAAANDDQKVCRRIRAEFEATSDWWHQFAVHEVSSVEAVDPWEVFRAAEVVAEALNLWHKASASAGDVAFWAPHAAMFDSPQAYALVISGLLDRNDFIASLALLIHWLSRADEIPLEQTDSSFHQLAERWLMELLRTDETSTAGEPDAARPADQASERWKLVRRFFDFLEANAEEYWHVPQFELGSGADVIMQDEDETPLNPWGESDQDNLYSAAYEGMVYQDSTDDGIDEELLGRDQPSRDELVLEFDRLHDRLNFLGTVARLWKALAISSRFPVHGDAQDLANRRAMLERWATTSAENYRQLMELLDAIRGFSLAASATDFDSMLEYDRRRLIKESLLERVIETCVETADAHRFLCAASGLETCAKLGDAANAEAIEVTALTRSMLDRDVKGVRKQWPRFVKTLKGLPLLYVPLARGGNAANIVVVRIRQRAIQDLLGWMPRIGLLGETCELIEIAREMERNHFVGAGAVTEFDELFKIGYRSIVESLVLSAQHATENAKPGGRRDQETQRSLVTCVERLTESLLISWLAHSRTLRLSVLERVKDGESWNSLVNFIKSYGRDLFTQRFLNLGNLRAILHQGVQPWLAQLQKDPGDHAELKLIQELDSGLSPAEAAQHLSLILEAIIENYSEYRDYNSTTTHSDRGDALYMLLDFLRLRARYERIVWNLKPVVLAHEILVRRGQDGAAKMWRRALAHRTAEEADQYLLRLRKLQRKYAMRMPTVADRLAERFVKPMTIDRLRSLVEPAMQEAHQRGRRKHFSQLQKEARALIQEPTGVGFEVPEWLVALEEEVERARRPAYRKDDLSQLTAMITPLVVPFAEAQRQLERWCSQTRKE